MSSLGHLVAVPAESLAAVRNPVRPLGQAKGPVQRSISLCPFCPDQAEGRYEYRHRTVAAFRDAYPVTEGHYLVVPLRHAPDYFAMTRKERRDAEELVVALSELLRAQDSSISGFNVGMNCGSAAGQTVEHAHIHLIPRRCGDTPHPRGGVRGVIPARQDY
jgi:ATP adenylyltransferase